MGLNIKYFHTILAGYLFVTICFWSSVTVRASTATTNFAVTATVLKTCTISALPLSFTAYTGAVDNSTTTISVTCTNGTNYNIGLSAGLANGATVSTRAMVCNTSSTCGSSTLAYALYQPGGTTTNWGQTIGTDTVAGTGTGTAQSLIVNGQIAAGLTPEAGSFADTITATITY
ncbi:MULTISPECIES: Csu type fimbrial protein [Acidiphilium]|uniref:Spore coat protein U (SCPU) domain-containing protein n=1 Tax=Acidiphilium rubrum TaxID=526 RepID=A0A8G2FG44_ACIRU|nr:MULTISPECIES: spore coat U domain-containing protein [Acidiphilium]SIQ71509.1 Spore coat protein U (SCPU) domain-containing protein [Acidiphilium rubrum]